MVLISFDILIVTIVRICQCLGFSARQRDLFIAVVLLVFLSLCSFLIVSISVPYSVKVYKIFL